MRVLGFICSLALLLALLKLPIGYYSFLRILVTIGAVLFVVQELKRGFNFWVYAFGIIAIIFNPIIPVYLGDKNIWMPIDLISAVLFLIKGLAMRNPSK